ncbi:MAG TPA: hypothetical protein PKY82_35820 [Pyrinomonadaceae bacterium]|nr:hypothetical protein [Pyrinomonadaceae bacterium]
MSNRLLEIATVIKSQLINGDKMRFFSWGATDFCYGEDQSQNAFLRFKVNGAIFKGIVAVTLIEGLDHYQVEFMQNGEVINSLEPIYCEELARVIDETIEKPAHISNKKDYLEFLKEQNQPLLV